MSTIDEAIYTILSNDSTFASYFSNIQEQVTNDPNSISYENCPIVTFTCESSPRRWRKPERYERWRFWITDTDFWNCKAIKNRISALFLQGYGLSASFNIQQAQVIDSGPDPVYETNISAYQAYCDVRFKYYKGD